ncbi:MAG: sulfatase modifying factor 1, partial [Candidatus Arcticimaribacter sp.]
MKKIFILIATGLLLIGCGNKRGELVGVKQKKWFPEKPFGMTLVEGGAYIMGKADDDMAQLQNAQAKTVTVRSFYMDETEITNSEYRQFVYWVRDSIALQMLATKADENKEEGVTDGIAAYAFADADTSDISEFQKYMRENYYDGNEESWANRPLNWDEDIEWSTEDYVDQAYVEVMDSLYLPPEVWYNGEMKLDVNKLKYRYRWFDAEQASLD